jgi:hypothetical protein
VEEKEETKVKERKEIIDLCDRHIEECYQMEREGYDSPNHDIFELSNFGNDKSFVSELPDIEGDEGFQMLQKQNNLMVKEFIFIILIFQDQKLEIIDQGVQVIKKMVNEMNKDSRLKKTLEKVYK